MFVSAAQASTCVMFVPHGTEAVRVRRRATSLGAMPGLADTTSAATAAASGDAIEVPLQVAQVPPGAALVRPSPGAAKSIHEPLLLKEARRRDAALAATDTRP